MKNLAFILFLCLYFISCSGLEKMTIEQNGYYLEDTNKNYSTKTERKVIFNSYLTLIVENPLEIGPKFDEIAKKYNGYVQQNGTYQAIIRVKNEKLDEAIKDISALGKIESKSLQGQDVTDQFTDNKIRLENAEKARKRYLELLAKAANVEETLQVEKELERLNETIDLLKGKINRIDHLTEYSTISINIKERKKLGVLGFVFVGLYKSVKWLFVRN